MPKQIATRSLVNGGGSTRDRLTGWTFAVSLNGFWVYLGALDSIGRMPHASTTAAWYALVGSACIVGAWLNRETLFARLRHPARPAGFFVVAAAVLGIWFLLNVVLISHISSLSRTFAGLLVLWSAPTALLALSLPQRAITWAAVGIAILGLGYAIVEWAAFLHGHSTNERFSPIARLDPISAAQIPAMGALALREPRLARAVQHRAHSPGHTPGGGKCPLRLPRPDRRDRAWAHRHLSRPAEANLARTRPGSSRGTHAWFRRRIAHRLGRIHLDQRSQESRDGPSTLHIRREWWTSAVEAIPDDPIVGHGVAMFVDNTPEARRMGVAGERTYPHNSPIESLYSLGLLGAIPYAIFITSALVALVALARRRVRTPAIVLAVGLWTFAFVNANISGEIGADAVLWSAGALSVGLYAKTASVR